MHRPCSTLPELRSCPPTTVSHPAWPVLGHSGFSTTVCPILAWGTVVRVHFSVYVSSRVLLGLHFGLARLLRVFESHLGFVESLGSDLVEFFLYSA